MDERQHAGDPAASGQGDRERRPKREAAEEIAVAIVLGGGIELLGSDVRDVLGVAVAQDRCRSRRRFRVWRVLGGHPQGELEQAPVAVRDRDPAGQAFLVGELDRAPIGEAGDREIRDRLDGHLVVERRGQDLARPLEKALALLLGDAVGDVGDCLDDEIDPAAPVAHRAGADRVRPTVDPGVVDRDDVVPDRFAADRPEQRPAVRGHLGAVLAEALVAEVVERVADAELDVRQPARRLVGEEQPGAGGLHEDDPDGHLAEHRLQAVLGLPPQLGDLPEASLALADPSFGLDSRRDLVERADRDPSAVGEHGRDRLQERPSLRRAGQSEADEDRIRRLAAEDSPAGQLGGVEG